MGLASCSLVKQDQSAAATICKRLLADANLPANDKAAILSTQGWSHFKTKNFEVR